MVQKTPEEIDTAQFPYISPLFADTPPDEIVQWTYVMEAMQLDEDRAVLEELGITGEDARKLQGRMTLGRLPFRRLIEAGVGFEDEDYSKLARMSVLARVLINSGRERLEASEHPVQE